MCRTQEETCVLLAAATKLSPLCGHYARIRPRRAQAAGCYHNINGAFENKAGRDRSARSRATGGTGDKRGMSDDKSASVIAMSVYVCRLVGLSATSGRLWGLKMSIKMLLGAKIERLRTH